MDIPEGYWGIYKDAKNMPLERFDPFRTIINEFGTKIGHITQFSPLRNQRPFEHKNNSEIFEDIHFPEEDSFCKIIKGDLPAVVLSKGNETCNHPLSVTPEKNNWKEYPAISIVNLFTPMARVLYEHTQHFESIKEKSVGIGLVHLPTTHFDSFTEISVEDTYELLKTTQVAHINSILELKNRYNIEKLSIMHFFNIGEEAGASICHLHSQTYIYANEGHSHGWVSLGFLSVPEFHKKQTKDTDYCLACEIAKNKESVKDPLNQQLLVTERLVYENDEWIVFTAFSPERDGQMRLIPKKHTSQFIKLSDKQLSGLADALVKANLALDEFVSIADSNMHLLQDRNILFRQENEGYDSGMHMLIDIIPIQRIGGAEIMETYRIATVFPEEVAKVMREKLKEREIVSSN